MSETLKARAEILRGKAAEVKTAPLLKRPDAAVKVAEDLADLVVDMAAQIDALTPFIDEAV